MAADMTNEFERIAYEDLSPEETWTRLGKGSFGCVYKGEYLGIEVAIKEVLDSNEYQVEKYFKREVTIMQEARHPNVVQYIGLSVAPQPLEVDISAELAASTSSFGDVLASVNGKSRPTRILIISEFLPGGNLRQYIANTTLPFPWRHRLSFAVDIARAVAYMHKRDCMHRDLKGENLLITENQRIKVCDFGFARLAPKTQAEVLRMSYCGTDGYMSPEIVQGAEFDLRTDIFSFGVILAEIIGRTLADAEVFRRYAPSFGIDLDEIHERASPGCPPAFIELAAACCATDPDDRPTIFEIVARLRAIERDLVLAERATIKTITHVGSLNFHTAAGRGQKRPSFARIPSYDGKVQVPARRERQSSASSINSSGSSDFEVALAGLHEVRITTDRGAEEPWLDDMPTPTKTSQGSYSTAVVRRSRLVASTTSSILTVRASPRVALPAAGVAPPPDDLFDDSGSLPSIPSSWLRRGPKVEDAAATSSASQHVTPESIAAPPSSVPSIATFQTARTATPSIAAATVNHPLAPDPTPAATQTMEIPLDGFLHRFSLVKPTWLKLFWSAATEPGGANACECCRKRFGRGKAYLQCDDCGYRSHTKCADAAPADCHAGVSPHASPSLCSTDNATRVTLAAPSTSSLVPPKVGGPTRLKRRSYGRA